MLAIVGRHYLVQPLSLRRRVEVNARVVRPIGDGLDGSAVMQNVVEMNTYKASEEKTKEKGATVERSERSIDMSRDI